MRMLLLHDWPGNVRELRNCIRGAFYASDGSVIRSGDITLAKRRKQNPRKDPYFRDGEFLTRAVDEYGGVRSAARALKIPPSTISDRLKRYRNEKK
jgi:transcriptional regulator of acetoin/glycerol metabolism